MIKEIKCKVCGSNEISVKYEKYPGYVEKTFYTIYGCVNCKTNFILDDETDKSIYEKIYSSSLEIEGYDKYRNQSEMIKSSGNPLKYLAQESSIYFSVYNLIKHQPKCFVLEVGCGYGYLTYALAKEGFEVTGIDISENAIKSAKENFGDHFSNESMKELANRNIKYDLIISTEVIEHVDEPNTFFSDCVSLLKPNGKIFLTTPNKDFCKPEAVWYTDLPPIHKFWFGKDSFKVLADKHNMNFKPTSFSGYFPKNDNRLVRYLRFQKEVVQEHVVDVNYKPFPGRKKAEEKGLRGLIKYLLLGFPVSRFISNLVYNLTIEKDVALAVVFWKK